MGRQSPWSFLAAVCCGGVLAACTGSAPDWPAKCDRTDSPSYAEGFLWWVEDLSGDSTLCIRQPRTGVWLATVSRSPEVPTELKRYLGNALPHVQLKSESRGVTTSTTHVHLLLEAGAIHAWRGCTSLEYLRDKRVLDLADSLGVVDVKGDGGFNAEAMEAVSPTWVLASPAHDLGERGWPLIPVTEYLEPHPLGRAEWMTVLSWMVGESARGAEAFDGVKRTYEDMVAQTSAKAKRVFTGSVADGIWHAPGKDSFVAQWIEDAGGTYALANSDSDANVELGMESLLEAAASADAWAVVTYSPSGFTRKNLTDMDPRHEDLLRVTDEVWVCNTASADYFGALVAHPEWVLQDLRDMMEGLPRSTYGSFERLPEHPLLP
jgi:iron complex transport system substrate-binding protein